MSQENRDSRPGIEGLGASFEASNSESYGGPLGADFEAHNSVPPDERASARPKHSRAWIWIVLVAVLLLAAFLVHHFSKDTTSAGSKTGAGAPGAAPGASAKGRGQQGPATITVGDSKTGDMNIYVEALGTVTPTFTNTIFSQITGRVLSVHYREGQLVRKGDPLIDVDPRPSEATLVQAQGTLKRDQAVLAEARIDLERYQAAFARNAIARQQLEDQEQVVLQDEGTVKTDEGTVAFDEVQLSYCHIVAPITGRVGLRLVDPGNTIFSGSGSTLVVITQTSPITVVFNVSEDDLPGVQAELRGHNALPVDAYDRSDDKKLETGRLTSLDNQVDTTTGTVKFRATFANPKLTLFPNQFVNARLLEKTLQNVVLIPSAAVQHNGTAAFVYVVKPGKAQGSETVAVQPITTLTSDDQNTAVQGIGPNVQIATSGFDRLENGAPVHAQQAGKQNPQPQGKSSQPGGSTAP